MRIDTNFKTVYRDNKAYELMGIARFASMGQGSSTIYQTMANAFCLRVKDDNIIELFTKFRQYRSRIEGDKAAVDTLAMWFDTLLVMSVRDYKPLEKQLDEIYGMKVWPSAEKNI
jgi:hypothetical protein